MFVRYYAEYLKYFIISFNERNNLGRQALFSTSIFTKDKIKLRSLCAMQEPLIKKVIYFVSHTPKVMASTMTFGTVP